MKNKYLHFVVMFGKFSIYAFVINALLVNALIAHESKAQKVVSVKEAKISFEIQDATLEQVFKLIESQSDYIFLFNGKDLSRSERFNMEVKDQTVASVLLDLSQQANLSFRQVNNVISVRNKTVDNLLEIVIDQNRISGRITDESGQGLPGATVVQKGTTNGTITDVDGNFTLELSSNGEVVLSVSFVGYITREVAVGNQSNITVKLEPDFGSLEEVVVVGYGSVKKRDLTGAVESVGTREITRVGSTSPMGALQTNVAGVNITPRTGSVGSDFDIQIRGANSLTGGAPLFVVDGVMTDNINFLNPNDIERIDILKDASSTAIYGSRGSNGVVIVTTKSGEGVRGQESTISYSGFVGLRTVANMPDFLNGYDEAVTWNMDREVSLYLVQGRDFNEDPEWETFGFPTVVGDDGVDYWKEALTSRRGTDWFDLLLKPSLQQNHFVSASGASDKVSYVVGFGYQGDNGNAKGQWYKKYNFKASIDAKATENFSIGTNINLAFADRELVSRQGYTRQIFRMPNWAPAYDSKGELVQSPMVGISGNVNPLAYLESNSSYNVEQYYLISNFYLNFQPADWISFRSTFSPNARFGRTGEYFDKLATRSISVSRIWNDNEISYIWDNQMNINREFGEHRVTYDFIQSSQYNRLENSFAYGRAVPFNSQYYNVQSGTTRDASSGYSKYTLLSFANRINYSYQDKYLITGTVRWDGSSKLAPGNKWAYFPSAAVAWRASEEGFLADVSQVNNLKLRVSFGYTGNNNIPPYTTQSAVDRQTYYDWNGTTADGFIPSDISNTALTWERTREWNFGADFGLFGNRISGEINVYDRLSLDLLMERKLAMPTGWGSIIDNVGSVSNKGVELQVSTVNIERGKFSWETNFIFSKNTNKIVDLYGKKEDDVPNRWFIGQPVDVVYAMVFDGIWQRDELAQEDLQEMEGTVRVKDLNNDGEIDIDNDMKVLGSPFPNWIGTFSTTFTYGRWDLSATLYAKQGVFIYSPFHTEFTDFNSRLILDVPYYVRDNPITEARYSNTYPQARYMGPYYGEDAEDYGYPGHNKDASFTRVQNITLGYNFSPAIMSKVGISELRVYFNAFNPFVFTKYDGFDPEWAGASMAGVDATNTSFSVYQVGANIKF